MLLLAGCASPGAPLPPSLKLPQNPTTLTATRIGDHVVLNWTTPARTTDRTMVTGPVTAEICRDTVNPAATPRQGRRNAPAPCNVVGRAQVSPGPSTATDILPPALTAGAPAVLAYRVQLLNPAGRTAGPTAPAYAASGATPEPVTGVHASSTKPGVLLEWTHATQPDDSVELERKLQQALGSKAPTGDKADSRFSARDTGGAIDRTAEAGNTYDYTVQRVRQVPFNGQSLEIRSEPSAPVQVAVKAVFPPDTPTGLVAAPAYSPAGKPSIDLSWEPNVELHIAGYKVYRRQADAPWRLLTPSPVTVAAYTDTDVTAGQRYTYRVGTVNDAGMESAPSAETSETAPSR